MKPYILTLLFLTSILSASYSQNVKVSGVVIDASTRETIPGVTVAVKGTSQGTVTDIDGKYSIEIASDATLIFSSIGYATFEEEVLGRQLLDISLKTDMQGLDEIVVTGTAAGTSTKKLSFSIGKVSQKSLENVPGLNIGNALQGKVAGLKVNTTSGDPSSGPSFQLRSFNSISVSSPPLVIIDGVISENGLVDVNGEDISRVEVAKGAAAASLYGSRAAGGVIQIFTKRAKGTTTKVTFRSELGISSIANKYELATKHSYKLNAEGTDFLYDKNGARISNVIPTATSPYPTLYDYQDMIFENGIVNTNYVSVSASGNKTKLFVSAQNYRNQGIFVENEGYQRNSLRLNVDHNGGKYWDLSASMSYTDQQNDLIRPSVAVALQSEPAFDFLAPNEEDGSPYNYDANEFFTLANNPLYEAYTHTSEQNTNRFFGSYKLTITPIQNILLEGLYGIDNRQSATERYLPKSYISDRGSRWGQANGQGYAYKNVSSTIGQTMNAKVLYTPHLDDFNFGVSANYLYEHKQYNYLRFAGLGLGVLGIEEVNNVQAGLDNDYTSTKQKEVAHSYFVAMDADYQEKYIVTGAYRIEGSSLFGPDERWNTYYRGSFAYRITEDFDISEVQELKLRASIGTAGTRPLYGQRYETFSLSKGVATKNTLGNPALRPQRSREIEVGVESYFLNAISFEFNYVHSLTTDQLLRLPLTGYTGFQYQWQNAGSVEGYTLEALLSAQIYTDKDWRISATLTWDRSRQTVTEITRAPFLYGPSNVFRIEEGLSLGSMYGLAFVRTMDDLPADKDPNDYEVNVFGYVVDKEDRTPVAKKNENDESFFIIGNSIPDFRMGFSNTIEWKGIRLYYLLDWKQGGDVYNQTRQWLYREQRAKEYEVGEIADFYAALYSANSVSEAFVEDGSFLKLRELSLAYTIKGNQLSSMFSFVNSLQIGLVARNLFTISSFTGYDPELSISNSGSAESPNNPVTADSPNGNAGLFAISDNPYPTQRYFGFNINIQFNTK